MAERVWCKTLQEENFWSDTKSEETYLLEEPAWRDRATGETLYTKAGDPSGRPGWKIGQKVVLYVAGTRRFPSLVVIVSNPYKSGNDDWPWRTDAKVLRMMVDDGPTLEQTGVPAEMVERRVRWRLDESQSRKVLAGFGRGSSTAG